ncbi:TIGR02594 family protein [Parasphingorhabdus sp.]|uniref:NlpC/P60 family protein n=1 Tax=Parasphingorhabdus sp. TaxID=2709688 RepID=UPI003C708151
MNFIEWVQRRLIVHGFNPGLPDGIWGRNTRAATIKFQTATGLVANGTLNSATVAALRLEFDSDTKSKAPPEADRMEVFPWMDLAIRKKGLHEGTDNSQLRKFLKSDGKTLGDPAQLPWCGDFVETCIAVTLPDSTIPTNPYLARNWLKFGHTVDPCYGAVMVFWRGKRSGFSGHVAFYYAEDDTTYHVLGGNQSNKVSVTRLNKDRLLGARLPLVGGPYERLRISSATGGEISVNEA